MNTKSVLDARVCSSSSVDTGNLSRTHRHVSKHTRKVHRSSGPSLLLMRAWAPVPGALGGGGHWAGGEHKPSVLQGFFWLLLSVALQNI